MSLKISHKTSLQKNIPFALFVFANDVIATHPLISFLEKDEKKYLADIRIEKVKEKEARVLLTPKGRKIFCVGLGEQSAFTDAKAGLATRMAVQIARKERVKKFAFWVTALDSKETTQNFYETVAANAVMANFEFITYKTPPPEGYVFLEEIEAIGKTTDRNITEGLRRGVIIGEETNVCRTLSNTPGGDMTPERLGLHAMQVAKKWNIQAKVLGEKEMKALGMGGVLGVGKGASAGPRFIILEYLKGPKQQKPVVLIGKGVTFDSGGLNLKPSGAIYEMHMDMSGGAAVIHTLIAAARLGLKKNIVVLVPAVENMPSGSSYRPGDVLRSMSGKTIEVLDTDAEGRVILADALSYAKKYNPSLVVDVATLTGAAMVALGMRYSGLFTPDIKLEEQFRALGEETGDQVWPLPLSVAYEDDIKGTFGDWANVGKTRYGGATTAAVFLWQFAKDYPWVHLDIAPRMTSIEGEFLAKGAAGTPVRLLIRLLASK